MLRVRGGGSGGSRISTCSVIRKNDWPALSPIGVKDRESASFYALSSVDVVVVTFNSAKTIQACLRSLVEIPDVDIVVVDNASADETAAAASAFPVQVTKLPDNRGFSHGNNVGVAIGSAPFVLFLNPDAQIDAASLRRLAEALEANERLAIAAPRILNRDGSLSFSLRRFPRLRSTYAQALFLQRLFPHAAWTDEIVRDAPVYDASGSPDWVSGACMLVRREMLHLIGGWDSGFFLYGEDIDLCRRFRDAGLGIIFVPNAVVRHDGGASMPRAALLSVLAASRIRYARKHQRPSVVMFERVGIGLAALTHLVGSRGGRAARRGHLSALIRALAPGRFEGGVSDGP